MHSPRMKVAIIDIFASAGGGGLGFVGRFVDRTARRRLLGELVSVFFRQSVNITARFQVRQSVFSGKFRSYFDSDASHNRGTRPGYDSFSMKFVEASLNCKHR